MASIASVISLIVLLAAYSYSLPVEDQFQSSTYPTPNYEFTTDVTIVDTTTSITAHLMNENESANVPSIKIPRGFGGYSGDDSAEYTTPAQSESPKHDTRESPMNSDGLFTSSPFTYISETPSSDLSPREFSESEFLDTTTFGANSAEETGSKHFQRAFARKDSDMDKSTSAEVFSSTPVFERESKESTSAGSNSRFTGSRANVRTQETSTRMSSEIKYRPTSEFQEYRSSEESNFRRAAKPTPFVPIKGTQTEALIDSRSKSYLNNQSNEKGLTQGSTLLLFLLAALLFCACLIASAIAIVNHKLNFTRKSRITEMEADLDKHH